jgi:hypothetical protein
MQEEAEKSQDEPKQAPWGVKDRNEQTLVPICCLGRIG